MPKVFYTGPGPDALDVTDPATNRNLVFERDGEGVEVDDALGKELLKRDDFQTSRPSRQAPKVEKADDDK